MDFGRRNLSKQKSNIRKGKRSINPIGVCDAKQNRKQHAALGGGTESFKTDE